MIDATIGGRQKNNVRTETIEIYFMKCLVMGCQYEGKKMET